MEVSAYGSVSVHFSICFGFVEETEHGGNEGNSIADESVDPVEPLQPGCIIATEEDEINVDGHGTRPHWVRLHKPSPVNMSSTTNPRSELTSLVEILETDRVLRLGSQEPNHQ